MAGGAGNDEIKNPKIRQRRLQSDPSPLGKTLLALSGLFVGEDKEVGPWTVVRDMDDHVGIMKVTVVDDSNLKIEYYRTMTGEMYDSVTLYREHSKPYGV